MPEQLTKEMIEEFRRLESAATKGPWTARTDGDVFHWVDYETTDGGGTVCDCTTKDSQANAALIVFLRNHAPALLAAVARSADLERLRKAVERYIVVIGPFISHEGQVINAALAKLTTTGEKKCN